MRTLEQQALQDSIAHALQFISHHHPPDFVRALRRAWGAETHAPARAALAQLLINSRLASEGRRPLCQDTGVVQVFLRVGVGLHFSRRDGQPLQGLQALVNQAVDQAYGDPTNPLRASMVQDPWACAPTRATTRRPWCSASSPKAMNWKCWWWPKGVAAM